MNYDILSLRYGELSLKGKNKKGFYDTLFRTVKKQLQPFQNIELEKHFDHINIRLNGHDHEAILHALKYVFGIHVIRAGIQVEKSLDAMKEGALRLIEGDSSIQTFKISARRKDKQFPYPAYEINNELGGYLLENRDGLKVDVHNPDVDIKVEVKPYYVNIFGKAIKGPGGMPVGTGGKILLMLSGGIDSPVAGFQLLKRGAVLEGIHFHSPPYTSERAKQKVIDLSRRLKEIGGEFKLHVVPFTKAQLAIHEKAPANYAITLMRRMMLRIAEKWASERGALALATGESLGQVASQTLSSMHTINEVTNYPVLRPLISEDKVDIIAIAQEIDTYDISIRPYEDCCTIFLPKAPKTKPSREKAALFEADLDIEALVAEAVAGIETLDLRKDELDLEDLF
ncbi:tRNA 4-thiouridine(8) synthase ThiI [Pullulanibacillus sp. KACC 23026]|uniref:tRNA uracil 4-sulfurtransferase ThiI n=1 Tax=Pullulanibacillus sp. KACC 23026 TaxID=3028315 RepID=UPI0023B19238|nr:tRNA uracil 4-sulfurtransferase ThiI [Pullulanibacillus sp. KACC 23026]WEG13877.1 tRNA 4-thiouridine(8) synthase ThiI [Pullulanibacillus sp. KACC 23026]